MSPLADSTLTGLIEDLGAKTPAPGGGAAASVTAAVGAGLGAMVLSWSLGRKSLAEHDADNTDRLERLQQGARRALELADEDARGYEALNTLMKRPEDDPERIAGWNDAVDGAVRPPLDTLTLCIELAGTLSDMVGVTNTMLASDLAAAAVLVEAAGRTAAWNVHANLPLLEEPRRGELAGAVGQQLADLRGLVDRVEQACR